MKKGRFYALLLGMALFMIILMPCSASASASQTLLPLQSGTIDEGEYIELDFTVPVESTLTISFVGYESGIGTYGDCFFWLQDNAGDIFWNAHDYISYDDRTFTTEVPKGNYKLGMRCEDWEFDCHRHTEAGSSGHLSEAECHKRKNDSWKDKAVNCFLPAVLHHKQPDLEQLQQKGSNSKQHRTGYCQKPWYCNDYS